MIEEFIRLIYSIPAEFWAVICGMLISWGFTQRIKFFVPKMHTKREDGVIQGIAFVLAFATTFGLWRNEFGAVAGVINGIWAPASYWAFVKLLRWKCPKLAWKLSKDQAKSPNYPDMWGNND